MLKRLLLWKYLFAVVVILGFCVYVSHKDQETRDEYQQECAQFNASMVPPSGHKQDCDKGADNTARHLPRWYRVFAWPDGITTWAILLTLLVIADQTAQTKKAAEAAMAQIQLMEEQSRRMVGKERARLKVQCEGVEVQGEPPGTWILVADIGIANHGSSNAYITRKRGKLSVAPLGGTTPELDDSCDILLPYPFDIIKPGVEPIHVVVYLEDAPSSFRDLCIGITSSRITMHLYGFIDYETMGEFWRLPFKYKWVMTTIPDNMSEVDLAKDINIVGGWDEPGQQENGEYRINPN